MTHLKDEKHWLLFWGNTWGPLRSWGAAGLVCPAPPHLEEDSEEQVWGLEMTHRPKRVCQVA